MAVIITKNPLIIKVRLKDGPLESISAVEEPSLANGWLRINTQAGTVYFPESQIISFRVLISNEELARVLAENINGFLSRFPELGMAEVEGKTVVTVLDDRFTIIGEKLSIDECRKAIEHIRETRGVKHE